MKASDWFEEEGPTEKQIRVMRNLGIKITKKMTLSEASKKISEFLKFEKVLNKMGPGSILRDSDGRMVAVDDGNGNFWQEGDEDFEEGW